MLQMIKPFSRLCWPLVTDVTKKVDIMNIIMAGLIPGGTAWYHRPVDKDVSVIQRQTKPFVKYC